MPDDIVIQYYLDRFHADAELANQIIRSHSGEYSVAGEPGGRLLTLLEVKNDTDFLIATRMMDLYPSLTQEERGVFQVVNQTRGKILSGYRNIIETYVWKGDNVRSFFLPLEEKPRDTTDLLVQTYSLYQTRTNPNFFITDSSNNNLKSYLAGIHKICSLNIPQEQKIAQAQALTLRFWGGALLFSEELHRSYNKAPLPFASLLDQAKSVGAVNYLMESEFEYGCEYERRLIEATVDNFHDKSPKSVDKNIKLLQQRYTYLFKHYKQALDACLTNDIDDYLTTAYLQTLTLRMEAIDRFMQQYKFRKGFGVYDEFSCFNKLKNLDQKADNSRKIYTDVVKSPYLDDYRLEHGLWQREGEAGSIKERLIKIQQLVSPFDNDKKIIQEVPHHKFPNDIFDSIEKTLDYAGERRPSKSVGPTKIYLYNGVAAFGPGNLAFLYNQSKEFGLNVGKISRDLNHYFLNKIYTQAYKYPLFLANRADTLSRIFAISNYSSIRIGETVIYGHQLINQYIDRSQTIDMNPLTYTFFDTARRTNDSLASSMVSVTEGVGYITTLHPRADAWAYAQWQDFIDEELPQALNRDPYAWQNLKRLAVSQVIQDYFSAKNKVQSDLTAYHPKNIKFEYLEELTQAGILKPVTQADMDVFAQKMAEQKTADLTVKQPENSVSVLLKVSNHRRDKQLATLSPGK